LCRRAAALALFFLAAMSTAQAQSFTVWHRSSGGEDGKNPVLEEQAMA